MCLTSQVVFNANLQWFYYKIDIGFFKKPIVVLYCM
jgi:hypothetical protein